MKKTIYITAMLMPLMVFSKSCLAEMISQKEHNDERLGVKVFFAGLSKHINEKGDPNESHKLIGVSYERFELIRMKNSYRETSVVLSRNNNIYSMHGDNIKAEFNIRTGFASGYERAKHDMNGIIPVIQPNIYMEHFSGVGFEFGVIPYSGEQSDGVVTVNVSYIF